METHSSDLIQSIPNLPIFFCFFLAVYLIAYFFVFRDWSPKIRPESASCLISLFHGTPAVFLASRAILADPSSGFASPNTATQDAVLDYSIAYFLMDLTHYVIFYPADVLFIGHHLATLFVLATCRYVVAHGAYAVLFLLLLAEVTSACQNAWTLASARRSDAKLAARIYDLLSPPFYSLYSVVRGFVGPYFVYKMASFYASGLADQVIPRWVWVSWVVVVMTSIVVSIVWISNLWIELYRERRGEFDEKKKLN